jgi:hypothetical protein
VIGKKPEKKFLNTFTHRFGTLAIEMGFVTIEQVLGVIFDQVMDNYYRKQHKKIGRMMMDKGLMSRQEVEAVLKKLSELHKRTASSVEIKSNSGEPEQP